MHSFFVKITSMLLLLIFALSILLKALGFGYREPQKPVDPTEPTTEITTQISEPSTTQPVTEEPSSQVTEPSTEPPTEEPSSQVTEPSTEPPTEEPSSQVTEPSTEPPTEEPSSQVTEPSTEPPTEEPSSQVTEPSTEPPTEEPSSQVTEPSTEPPTEEPSSQVTEPSTEPPTEEPSSQVTEPSTEPPTEEPSSQVTEPSTEPPTEEPSSQVTKPSTTEPTTKVEIGPQIRTVNQSYFAPFGGTGNDIFTDVDNTSDGGFVACGKSTSTDQDLQGVPQSSWSNYSFVVKFDKDGKVVWKKAASSSDRAYELLGIAVLNDGSIVTVGHIKNSESNPVDESIVALILKYSADGKLLFEKRVDGTKSDIFTCVCATKDGFAVGGKSESNDGDFTFNQLMSKESPVIISYDSAANVLWQTSFPGNNGGSVEKIAADQYGNVFSTISTTSTTGSYAAFEGLGKGYIDTVVLKHDSKGNYIWNYVIASAARDEFGAITADEKGGCVVAGNYELVSTHSPDGTLAGLHNCGGIDAVVMRIDSTGKRTWAKVIGGFGNDYINDITTVADGGYAVAGYTTSSDRDFAEFEHGGENDAFIAFITPGGNVVDIQAQGGSKNDMLNCVAYSPLGGVMALGQTTSKDGTFNGMNSHLNDIYIIIFGFLPFTGYIVKYRVSISKY